MRDAWKRYLLTVTVAAAAGFVLGLEGARVENYYITSGPSFPEHAWGPLRYLGYPGYVFAGRTGPPGFIEFTQSYDPVAVAAWNAAAWAVTFAAILGVLRLVRRLAARGRTV